ncbi:IS1096 element passenger TnpR family protein [Corynebacterium sp. A21]|uniref:IS1096 element passenger TnpR family protein n=1 Tax=Corynebacterium sp. A21 TaxID=3457318 RepID=UPI003FD1E9EB
MPSVTLHFAIEGSEPKITRTVVLSSRITLADLHEVICNAFEFTGHQEHHFRATHPSSRTGWSTAEEPTTVLPNLLVDPYGSALYHYGTEESWVVHIKSLGFPTERMLVPKLIDATGPDIIEGCGGPQSMTQMRDAAVHAIAALDLDLEAADHIADHLPGLHPHQVLQRLTYIDPATIASRVCFAILPGYVDGLGPVGASHGDGTATDALANPEDWPNAFAPETTEPTGASISEPDRKPADPHQVREQLPDGGGDTHLLGAETIREIRDALKDFPNITFAPEILLPEAPENADPTELTEDTAATVTASIRWFLRHVEPGLQLTQAGYLKPADVVAIAAQLEVAKYYLGKLNREIETPPVLIMRQTLEHLGLIKVRSRTLTLTQKGRELRSRPLDLARHLAGYLPLLSEPTELLPMRELYARWYHARSLEFDLPKSYARNRFLLLGMNVLDRTENRMLHRDEGPRYTPAGRVFLAAVLTTEHPQ